MTGKNKDLALLKIEPKNSLPEIKIGNSEEVNKSGLMICETKQKEKRKHNIIIVNDETLLNTFLKNTILA